MRLACYGFHSNWCTCYCQWFISIAFCLDRACSTYLSLCVAEFVHYSKNMPSTHVMHVANTRTKCIAYNLWAACTGNLPFSAYSHANENVWRRNICAKVSRKGCSATKGIYVKIKWHGLKWTLQKLFARSQKTYKRELGGMHADFMQFQSSRRKRFLLRILCDWLQQMSNTGRARSTRLHLTLSSDVEAKKW